MNTLTSNPIQLKALCLDVKSDAEGVILGAQSDGELLIDIHMTDMTDVDLLIVALVNGRHHCLAAREG